MASVRHTKVLILGSGPAGLTAAIYTARANLKPLLVAGLQPGGQMTITSEVENYPGFSQVVKGPWLMEEMEKQALHVGTEIIHDTIVAVHLHERPIRAIGDSGAVYTCDTMIIATGAQAKWLGLPSEKHLQGFGVSACATCDGFFFKGKAVAVIGGGNTAVEEAIYLTHHASSVTLIHRRDSFRAEKIMQDRLFANDKITVVWDSVVEEIVGGDTNPPGVSGVKIKNVKTGTTSTIPVDGVFVAIGHTPNTALFKEQITVDGEGYLVTKPGTTQTDVPGVFAAGDVQDKVFRQAVTAAGTGCMAAIEAERWLLTNSVSRASAAE